MTNETTASQPKSIGDDAQFQALLQAVAERYEANNEHGFMAAVVGLQTYIDHLLDSRAPAAQASATIQAAPVGVKYEADDGTVCARRDGKQLWHAHIYSNGDDEAESEIAKQVVAALAAPMVADPAGVTLEMTDAQIDDAICLVYATDYQEDSAAYDRAVVRAALAALAATVKAVPSEALDLIERAALLIEDAAIYDCYGDISISDGKILADSIRALAAPLADKTGGGE